MCLLVFWNVYKRNDKRTETALWMTRAKCLWFCRVTKRNKFLYFYFNIEWQQDLYFLWKRSAVHIQSDGTTRRDNGKEINTCHVGKVIGTVCALAYLLVSAAVKKERERDTKERYKKTDWALVACLQIWPWTYLSACFSECVYLWVIFLGE